MNSVEQALKAPALAQALLGADGGVVNANAQAAFPLMVQHLLPVGVRGVVVAGLLAGVMWLASGSLGDGRLADRVAGNREDGKPVAPQRPR